MKKTLLLTTLLSTLAITTAQARNGIDLLLEGGISQQGGLPSKETANATNMQTSYAPNSIRFGVGYNHDLSARFAIGIESALGWYGKTTYTYADGSTTNINSRALEFLGVGTFHATSQLDLLLKAGGLRLTPIATGRDEPKKNAKICSEAAIGAAYNFTPNLAVTLTYSHVFGSQIQSIAELDGKGPSLNEGMLGIRYTFSS